jgi:hypothetical protein
VIRQRGHYDRRLDRPSRMALHIMEASTELLNTTMHDDLLHKPACRRIPVEIWHQILQESTTSSLFPYSDGTDNDTLSFTVSIIHKPYPFQVHQEDDSLLFSYFDYEIYAEHQRGITRLRLVCRLWNEIFRRYLLNKYQFMHSNHRNFHFPPPPSTNIQRRPRLILVDENIEDNHPATPVNLEHSVTVTDSCSVPTKAPTLTLSDHDLSYVRIAIVGEVSPVFANILNQMASLRILSIDTSGSYAPNLHDISHLSTLTHLHLFGIMPSSLMSHQNIQHLHFPKLRYLALHFDRMYFDTSLSLTAFPSWTLEQLTCLSIAGIIPQHAEMILGKYFGLLIFAPNVSEVLLDFKWRWTSRTVSFFERVRTAWFPRLRTLGFPTHSIDIITSSLLSKPKVHLIPDHKDGNSGIPQRLYLFLLASNPFECTTPVASPQQGPDLDLLALAYQAGHIERIYLSEYDAQICFVKILVKHALELGIPVYDAEGWQIYTNSV